MLSFDGCGEKCAIVKHGLEAIDVYAAHNFFAQLANHRQRQWVLDYIVNHTSSTAKSTENTKYIINGKDVCFKLWLAILNLKTSRFYEIRSLFHQGIMVIPQRPSKDLLPKTIAAIDWMEKYFQLIGDIMPDTGAIHLPQCLSRRYIIMLTFLIMIIVILFF